MPQPGRNVGSLPAITSGAIPTANAARIKVTTIRLIIMFPLSVLLKRFSPDLGSSYKHSSKSLTQLESFDPQRNDRPRLALDRNRERSAANFAIRNKALPGHARIDGQIECFPAKRTRDWFGNFHVFWLDGAADFSINTAHVR